jgi:NTE family protein
LLLALVSQASASDSPEVQPETKKLALALSGGGARGIAHIGVLKALEENGIAVDSVAGTSMGAVVGALFAAGHSSAAILDIVRSVDWDELFSGKPNRAFAPPSARRGEIPAILTIGYELFRVSLPEAALSDYTINRILAKYLLPANFSAGRAFDRLPIPFRAVTTDLRTGERVVHASGSLNRAVRASMSIPLAFAPVPFGEYLLVDGGLVENIPVTAACEMGATFVVAVDVTSPPREPEEYSDLIGIAGQLTDVLSAASNRVHLENANLTLRPHLEGHSFTDYSNFDALVEVGYRAAQEAMPELKELLLHRAARPPRDGAPLPPGLEERRVAAVRIVGQRYLPDGLIRGVFRVPPGEPIRLERILEQMDSVYATGFFESCWLDFLPEGEAGAVVELHVKEAKRRVAEIGAAYQDEDKVSAFVRLNNRNLLRLGEQLKLMGAASDGLVSLRLSLARDRSLGGARFGYGVEALVEAEKPRYFSGDVFLNRAEFDRRGVSLAGRLGLGRPALAEVGLAVQEVETEERLTLPLSPGIARLRTARLGFLWDDLDDLYQTTGGRRVQIALEKNFTALGASSDYWRASLTARAATRLTKRQVLNGRALLGVSEGELPAHEQFRVGGPFLLPGYHRDSLWGNQALAASIGYDFLLTPRFRLRTWTGAGDVWQSRREMTLGSLDYGAGIGFEYASAIGPISLDFAKARSGPAKVYFAVGFNLASAAPPF